MIRQMVNNVGSKMIEFEEKHPLVVPALYGAFASGILLAIAYVGSYYGTRQLICDIAEAMVKENSN